MAFGTVVVLPAADPGRLSVIDRLQRSGYAVRVLNRSEGPAATDAARICAELNADPPHPPLSIVAFGSAARLLPAVALAQRSAHRAVREYLLVDPELPPVSDGWPDAHVTVFSDGDQNQARLRGWTLEPMDGIDRWSPLED